MQRNPNQLARPAGAAALPQAALRGFAAAAPDAMTIEIPVPFETHKCEPPSQTVQTSKSASTLSLHRSLAARLRRSFGLPHRCARPRAAAAARAPRRSAPGRL